MNTPPAIYARRLFASLLCGGALLASSTLQASTTTINFTNAESVTTAFPTTFLQGTASSVGFDTNRIHLFATTGSESGSAANANAYSAASYSTALNFFENGGTTLTFNNVSMTNSAGTAHFFNFGFANRNSGNFSSATQRIFFRMDRNTSSLSLMANSTTLATWTLATGAYRDLEYASITLTATTWSATVLAKASGSEAQTHTGTFSTALSLGDWSQFNIGMQVGPGATAADRSTNGYIGSIDIQSGSNIPEPSTAAALTAAGALALSVGLRRKRATCAG